MAAKDTCSRQRAPHGGDHPVLSHPRDHAANGVPILQALAISRDATGSALLAKNIDEAIENVRAGEPLTEPLKAGGMFPEQVIAMISVAEESNQMQKVLLQIADSVERRTNQQVDQAVRLIEPAILCLVAAGIGFLALGLLLHGSPIRYSRAIEDGARCCAGIILQFPLYAGIMGVMSDSGLGQAVSRGMAQVAGDSEGALATMTFLSAGLVNLFVPSGGGQWAMQGPIAMQAAVDAGAAPARIVMAVAYGDQLTNMLQPFWALPLLAITGARAREVVGYTAILMVVAAVWLVGCLVLV